MTDKDHACKPEIVSPDEKAKLPSAESNQASAEAEAKPPEFLLPHEGFE